MFGFLGYRLVGGIWRHRFVGFLDRDWYLHGLLSEQLVPLPSKEVGRVFNSIDCVCVCALGSVSICCVDSIAAGGQWRETKRGVVPQQGKCRVAM